MTRRFVWVYLLLCCASSMGDAPPFQWEITDSIKNPESVFYDPSSEILFISNVAGDPKKIDGIGWISKADAKGKIVKDKWVTGLNAPKGMAVSDRALWVADIQRLVKIDIGTGTVIDSVFIASARFLNDVAIGPKGEVFVSDTLTSRIYEYSNRMVRIFAQGDDLESPNGLLVKDGKLIVAAWGLTTDFSNSASGRLYSLDLATKQKTAITSDPVGNLDGLQWDGKGYLVSDWQAGKVFRISPEGNVQLLLSGFRGAADLCWMPDSQLLVLPRMSEDRVSAFQLVGNG